MLHGLAASVWCLVGEEQVVLWTDGECNHVCISLAVYHVRTVALIHTFLILEIIELLKNKALVRDFFNLFIDRD